MDLQRLQSSIDRTWDESIVERLIAYVRIPNKSPAFDPEWQQHGYMEAAVALMADWCRAHAAAARRRARRGAGKRAALRTPRQAAGIHRLAAGTRAVGAGDPRRQA